MEQSRKRIVRFGPFELDPENGELRKQGIKLQLQPKPREMLQVLLERPGDVVTREELRHRLWGDDTFVDFESGLNTAANRLRLKLGDSAEHPRYIETLARKGYRFKGSATVVTEGVLFERAMTYYRREHGLADGIAERIRHIVVVKITRALPLVSPVYDDGTTEGDVVRKWSAYYDTLRLNRSPR